MHLRKVSAHMCLSRLTGVWTETSRPLKILSVAIDSLYVTLAMLSS